MVGSNEAGKAEIGTSEVARKILQWLDGWILASLIVLFYVLAIRSLTWEINYYFPGMFFVLIVPTFFLPIAMVLGWPVICLGSIFFRWRTRKLPSAAPLLLAIISSLSGLFLNTTVWWLKYNDWLYASRREDFMRAVADGGQFDQGTYGGANKIRYKSDDYLAIGGVPAFYKPTPQGPMVMFPTFMGIPDGMSGFLYAPPGIDPKMEWPELALEWANIWDESRNIYFVGNR